MLGIAERQSPPAEIARATSLGQIEFPGERSASRRSVASWGYPTLSPPFAITGRHGIGFLRRFPAQGGRGFLLTRAQTHRSGLLPREA